MKTKIKIWTRLISLLLCLLLSVQCATFVASAEQVESEKQENEEPTLVGELVEKRQANEKYFLYDDRTIVAAVYPTAVHYMDEGGWQNIDNRLLEDQDAAELGNSFGAWNVKFSKKAKDGKLAKLKYGNHNITWYLSGAEKTEGRALTDARPSDDPYHLPNVSSGMIYEDILEDVDLEYQLIGDRIKENIIIKSSDAPTAYTFVYETGKLEMVLSGGEICLTDGQETVLRLASPIMTDAALEESADISLSLHTYKSTGGNHMYAVTVTPDAAWLAAEERVYPITVDPVIITEQTYEAIEDTHAASSAPNQVRTDWTTTKVGMHGTANVYRAFLKFALPTGIGVGDRVVNASLALWPNTTLGDLETMAAKKPIIEAHEVTEDWDNDTLTWNNQPSCNTGTVLDYDYIGAKGQQTVARWYSWNITDLVDKWYTTGNNYGVMLKYNSETDYGSNMVTNFVSSETNVTSAAYPLIEISYVNTLGLENYYTYHSVDVGHAGTAYVNDYTGALTCVTPIAGVASERAPINLSLVYTPGSNDTTINKLNVGNNFMLNLQSYMKKETIGGVDKYKYVDGDGTAHYFAKVGAKWLDEDGLGYELTLGTTYWTITTKQDSTIEFFATNGRLYRTADHNKKNGDKANYVKLSYSGEFLSSITNGTETINITRYTQNNKEHIKFDYPDSDGKRRYALIVLTEYNNHIENIFQYVNVNGSYSEQSRVGFKYSNRAVSALIDGTDMHAARFGYTTTIDGDPRSRRVTSYNYCPYEGSGNFGDWLYSYAIVYDKRSTKYTVTYQEGETRYELYTFDRLGHTVTGQDTDGNAVFQELGLSGGAENKVTFSSKTQRSVANLALNHNFEKGSSSTNTPDWYFYGDTNDNSAVRGAADGDTPHIGNLTMKIYKHSASSTVRATTKQAVTLTGGKVYTLSAYVKTDFTSVSSNALAGACIAVERLSSPVAQYYRHAIVSGSGYTRQYVTVDLTGAAFTKGTSYVFNIVLGTHLAKGVAYFDCVQLEEGNSANSYNAVENAGFENRSDTTSWVKQNMGDVDGYEIYNVHSGTYAYKFTGSPKHAKRMYQTIPVKGQKGNAFTAGVWVKSNTLPNKDIDEDGAEQSCSITLEICHTDGSKQYESTSVDTACTQWRYICLGMVADEAFSHVNIYLKYPYNCNTTYFDDVCLFMDSFGQRYEYDGENRGNVVATIDLANNKTNIKYTADDEIASYTDAAGKTYTNTYKSTDPHLLDSTVDPKNMTTRYSYNAFGQPTLVNITSTGGMLMQSETAYTSDGHFTTQSRDVNNITVSQDVDAKTGRLNISRVPTTVGGVTLDTFYEYDPLTKHNTKVGVLQNNAGTSIEIFPVNVSYSYDRGNLTDIVRAADDEKQMGYHYTYDAFGRATKVEWSGKTAAKLPLSETEYLPAGPVGKVTYGNGQVLSYSYNRANLNTGVFVGNTQINGFEYNANNALGYSWYLNESGAKVGTHYFYDLAGRVSGSQSDTGFSSDGYLYDLKNNLVAYRSSLIDQHANLPFTTTYQYNEDNAPVRLIPYLKNGYASGEMRYAYDGLGRMTIKKAIFAGTGDNVTSLQTNITYKTYLDKDGVERRTLQPSTVKITENLNGTENEILRYYNLYHPSGSLSRMRVTEGGVRNYTHYEYDALGQLTVWRNTGTNDLYEDPVVEEYTHQYDDGGNLTQIVYTDNNSDGVNNGYTASYTYDSNLPDLLTGYRRQYANGTVTNRTYSYTADNGQQFVNPTTIVHTTDGATTDTWTMEWEQGRQLSSITTGSGTVNYHYNENGLRTLRELPNGARREYFYNGTQLEYIKIVAANGNLTSTMRYIYNTSGQAEYIMYIPAAYAKNGNVFSLYYIQRDSEGKIHKLIKVRQPNSAGTGVTAVCKVAVTYTYSSYGELLKVTKASGESVGTYNPLVYKDYIWDSDTDWYYVGSRYYDPVVGRFINADNRISGVGGSILGYNMFAYCMNNPVNMSDPSGNWPKWATKLVVAVAIVAVVAVVAVATAGTGTALACIAAGAAKGAAVGFAVGAATGAASGAINHRISTGSWDGAGEAALNGMADGALSGTITGAITGGINSNVCFVAGTAVLSSAGFVAIETIRVGDKVWAENPETGQKELKEVVQTFVNETEHLVHVFVNDEEIITTPEHPFYSPVKGWTAACKLRAGDILVSVNGEYVIVEKIQHEILETPITVYNFEVADFHTYYVGKDSILVHNVCGTQKALPKNGIKVNSSDALDLADDFLGKGYSEMSPGRFVSSDGLRQVRMTASDLTPINNHAGAPHLNFEKLVPNPLKPGKFQIIENSHVYIFD